MPRKKKTSIRLRKISQTSSLKVKSAKPTPYSFKLKKNQVIAVIIFIIVIGILYYFRGLFIAALVNGKPIFRTSVIQDLERQGGKQTLDSLITENLVFQEAKKKNVSVSDKEVNDEIKKIEDQVKKQGQSFELLLSSQGITRESLKKRIKLQKLVEKMVGKEITISDKEVNEYIKKNKDSIPSESDPQKIREGVKTQLIQQKLSEKVQTWLSNLQKNAQILYFVKY